MLAGARDPEASTAIALVSAGAIAAPLALARWDVDAEAVPYLVASCLLQLTYFALLAAAYRRADLSVVYPLARGLAPVFVLAGAVVFTGAPTSAGQVGGVLLVAAGVLLVRGLGREQGFAFGVAIAALIAAYTVVDKHGVAHASPVAYVWVITLVPGLVYAVALGRQYELRAALGLRAVAAGVASIAAYGLVLAALKLAPAASVAAVRESSVVIATALAAVVLKERVSAGRFGGAVLVVGGVALLAR